MQNKAQQGIEAFQAGRTDEALSLLQAAVQENPQDAEARKFLGAVLAQSGRAGEAVAQLQQAVQLSPQNAQIHYNLGVAQAMNGDNEGAKTSYYSALKINPQYEQARTALTALGAPLPPASTPSAPMPVLPTSDPFSSTSALNTYAPPVDTKPGAVDYFKALIAGGIAAIVGAFIWDKFVYYTNIEFGLISVGIGFLVGLAITLAVGAKRGIGLQVLGAMLALWGMLLGYALLIVDAMRENPQIAQQNPLIVLLFSFQYLPEVFKESPISLIFVAIGTYQGWIMPAAGTEAPTAPVPEPLATQTPTSQTPASQTSTPEPPPTKPLG
ncbi:MAG TPA: tetratricopeptide repeat protein [Abditibacteriaceae bacterium]